MTSMAKTKKPKPTLPVSNIEVKPDKLKPIIGKVILELPVVKVVVGYVTNRCDVRMTGEQAILLKQLENGFIAEGAKLQNGKLVANGVDAFKYILELTAKPQATKG